MRAWAKGSGDSPHFIPLLNTTTQRFAVKQVSGDKGYLDEDNLAAVAAVGAVPFVSFKDNSRGMDHPNEHWRRMFAYFDLKKEEFLRCYHRRSNVESTFGALKMTLGDSVHGQEALWPNRTKCSRRFALEPDAHRALHR